MNSLKLFVQEFNLFFLINLNKLKESQVNDTKYNPLNEN